MKNVGILKESLIAESLPEILTKKNNSDVLQDVHSFYIDVHSVTNVVGKSISSISMWNIVNQLGKHDFSCG